MALINVIECDSCGKRYEGASIKETEDGLVKVVGVYFHKPGSRISVPQEDLYFCDGTCASEWFLSRIGKLYA